MLLPDALLQTLQSDGKDVKMTFLRKAAQKIFHSLDSSAHSCFEDIAFKEILVCHPNITLCYRNIQENKDSLSVRNGGAAY